MDHERRSGRREQFTGIGLLAVFGVWTMLIQLVDVQAAGPDGTHIGDLCFKGIKADCNPEIGYGILEEHRGQGFATEAVKLALLWAFRHPDVNAIEAETDPYNAASAKVLMKCGFRPNGEVGEEGPRYIVENNDEYKELYDTVREGRGLQSS